jgi:site-specific recombinase XerD
MITLTDLTASEVAAFLKHTEHERGGTIGTRNCRLAAIRSFFNFVATRDPESVAQCAEILNIPIKRAPVSEPCYLEPAEVAAILAQPDRSAVEGLRDHTLLSFLYNSGARIQEALDLCPDMIRFDSPSCVRLTSKDRKERICPLWPETVLLLKKLLERKPRAPDQTLFVNRYGEPLSASGVRFKLAGYVKAATETKPSLHTKHVTPHREWAKFGGVCVCWWFIERGTPWTCRLLSRRPSRMEPQRGIVSAVCPARFEARSLRVRFRMG